MGHMPHPINFSCGDRPVSPRKTEGSKQMNSQWARI